MSSSLLLPASGVQWGRSRLQGWPAKCAFVLSLPSSAVCRNDKADSSTDKELPEELDKWIAEPKKPNLEYDEEYLKYLDVMEQKMPEYPPEFPLHLRDRDLSHVINHLLQKARDNPAFQHEWDYYPNIVTPRSSRVEPSAQQLMWQRFSQRNPFVQVYVQQMAAMLFQCQVLPSDCCQVARTVGTTILAGVKQFLCSSLQAIFCALLGDF